jgi:hypothetical protein
MSGYDESGSFLAWESVESKMWGKVGLPKVKRTANS